MYDVLIIGSGAAGLTAALNAKKQNKKVLVVSKTYPTHSQTVQAQGGINAVLYEGDDSVDQHVDDTYKASKGLAKAENINFMCKEAKATISWLNKIGVPFTRDENNNIAQRKFGGTKKIRTCYSSDYTGLKILHTLYDQCVKEDIEFLNEHHLLDLITDNDICKGAIIYDIVNANIKQIASKTTVIASGGYAGIYTDFTTNSYSNTADGQAVALKANVELSNMEFVQFHPTALKDSNILISESARGEGGYLLNKNHERFINELAPRDEISRAILEKILDGEEVFLDLRHLGVDKIKKQMPQERRLALEFSNVKLEDELLPINPAAHYSMGGIYTNIDCKTNITNLYAVGECAQSSLHGANRLGGNSLLEIVTFGKVAGLNAADACDHIETIDDIKTVQYDKAIDKITNIFNKENKINFYDKKDQLGQIMFNKVGLFRDETSLNEALDFVNETINELTQMGIDDKEKYYNKNLIEYLEFENMLDISLVVIQAALKREESRGAHFRIDYPNADDKFETISIAKKLDDNIQITFEEIS